METMTEKEFIDNAKKVLSDCSLTEDQADAIANLTLILEKSKVYEEQSLQREFFI